MSVLYRKPIKAQNGKYIFNSIEDIYKLYPELYNIRAKNPGSDMTRCVGSAHDASKICGIDYRALVAKAYDDATMRLPGENDAIVDAWNWKDAANNTDEIEVLYDRERDGPEILQELLKNLPLHAFIGTGNAGKKGYVKESDKIRSSHGIFHMGYLPDGTNLIYDLTKIKKGIPANYLNNINYIAVPKGGSYTTFTSMRPSKEEEDAKKAKKLEEIKKQIEEEKQALLDSELLDRAKYRPIYRREIKRDSDKDDGFKSLISLLDMQNKAKKSTTSLSTPTGAPGLFYT